MLALQNKFCARHGAYSGFVFEMSAENVLVSTQKPSPKAPKCTAETLVYSLPQRHLKANTSVGVPQVVRRDRFQVVTMARS